MLYIHNIGLECSKMSLQEKQIIERLKNARIENSLTGDEVAKRIGKADNSFISRLENGKQKLNIEIINKLCLVYQINPASLFALSKGDSKISERRGFLDNLEFRSEIKELPITAKNEIKNLLPTLRRIGKVRKRLHESPLVLKDFFSQAAELLSPSSISEAANLGKKVARALRTYLNLGQAPVADIYNLVWHFMRVPICNLDLGEKCWGIYNKDSSGNPLIIYSSSNKTKQRNIFTIAHELGHHFFFPEEPSIDTGNLDGNIKEKLANAFAQEFLVPINSLNQYMRDEGLLLIELRQNHIVALCQYFKVSYSMMLFVLYENNLVKRGQYNTLKQEVNELKQYGYEPKKYMADSVDLKILLQNLVARGIRTGKINYLFASEMLDLTQEEVKTII